MSRPRTVVGEAYRAALLRASSWLPRRLRHSFLRQRLALIKLAQARVEQRQSQHKETVL